MAKPGHIADESDEPAAAGKLRRITDEQGRGFIIFGEIEDCTCVFELMVDPEWRRQGVGTSLLQKAIELTGKPRVWFGRVSEGGMALARKFDRTARFEHSRRISIMASIPTFI
jgi:GNAT superfamily N-acetyltransferase